MHSPDLIQRIEAAALPATTYRTARRLLDLASDDGHVTLARADMLDICDTDKWNTVRAHLGQLARAGIIHYSTNAQCYVNFVIAERTNLTSERSSVTSERSHPSPPVIAERSNLTSERSPDDPMIAERAQMTPERSSVTSERSNGHTSLVSQLVSSYPSQDPGELTNCATDVARTVAMLAELGVATEIANGLASKHSFNTILRHVAAWQNDMVNGRAISVGGLVTRISANWTAPSLSDTFRRSAFCAQHAPEHHIDPNDNAERRQYLL